jgi:hypothetical protein
MGADIARSAGGWREPPRLDPIGDTFKRGKYQDVILPLTVLRGLDCVLAPRNEKVLAALQPEHARGARALQIGGPAGLSPPSAAVAIRLAAVVAAAVTGTLDVRREMPTII